PGDLYSLSDLKDSRNALGRTGYFESNTIEEKRIDDESMDLIVQAKEAPTGNIQLGGGYGSFGGILLSVAVSDRNIFGSGINVGLNLERSQRTSNYSFNISNPRLNDSDFSGNFSVFNSSTEYDSYTTSALGTSVGVGHRFNRYWSGYMGYNYSKNDYSDIDSTTSTLDPRYYANYAKSSVIASATFDNTDDYYIPREGISFSQSIEKAGVGGDADFIKSRTTFGAYQGLQKLTDFDLILRYKARFNYAEETGYLPLGEKFYMGGIGSVRGYQGYSISPTKGTELTTNEPFKIGGTQTFSNSLEFSVPLVPEAKMRATAFVDYGMIGEDSLSEIKRGGYGVSLEWFSPVGPLQLVFANPIGDKPGDDITHFEFTIGQRF
ncbi:MAG TPA: outer membrane protein assembly factor BamA, partial [Sulfuricurvum sp.]|nr:outer membrane protein assembly factor BamA [Sulfuricurvum sp.]